MQSSKRSYHVFCVPLLLFRLWQNFGKNARKASIYAGLRVYHFVYHFFY